MLKTRKTFRGVGAAGTLLRTKQTSIVAAYSFGASLENLAIEHSVSRTAVKAFLCNVGVNIRRRGHVVGIKGAVLGKHWKLQHVKKSPNIAGCRNPQWKGGTTPEDKLIRTSAEYRAWRCSVLKRDKYSCVLCGRHSCADDKPILHADHIKSFAEYPELRLEVSNGRTLCKECHHNVHWGGYESKA